MCHICAYLHPFDPDAYADAYHNEDYNGYEAALAAAKEKAEQLYAEYEGNPFEQGTGNGTAAVTKTGDARIDGVLTGVQWTGTINYSFPTSNSVYNYTTSLTSLPANFVQVTTQVENAAHFALNTSFGPAGSAGFSIEGITNANVTNSAASSTTAEIRFGETSSSATGVNTARVADFPGNYITSQTSDNGDVWFGDFYAGTSSDLRNPVAGNYAWLTTIHEIGHAVGLKHGHNVGGTVGGTAQLPTAFDAMEYSVMTYRSYIGGPSSGGYTNENWGFAQSWMMSDIAALQQMYGADFTTNSTDTVYKWNPGSGNTLVDGNIAIQPGANRIFATIWDGGGNDTYDLSSYTTDLDIDLRPGEFSLFSATQQANLGAGNFAQGNIYNALQFNSDSRSLIENAIGGSGSDVIDGNEANNLLEGNAGNDTINGFGGNDTLIGGSGDDSMEGGSGTDIFEFFAGDHLNDTISGGTGTDKILLSGLGTFNLNGAALSISSIEEIEFNADLNGTKTANFTIKEFDSTVEVPTNLRIDSSGGNVDILNFTVAGAVFATTDWSGWIFQDWDDTLDEINITLGGAITNFTATQERDNIQGSANDETINGFNDNDTIDGNAGDDTIFGGEGNDTLDGGSGVDSLNGGNGDDVFVQFNGWTGGDTYNGGAGTDTFDTSGNTAFSVVADLGAGTWSGGGGPVTLISIENLIDTDGNGDLTGSSGNNLIDGAGGNDTIDGAGGDDTLIGGDGNDSLIGGFGADSMVGGIGNDTLDGDGGGADSMDGGSGDDLFLLSSGSNDSVEGGAGIDTVDYRPGIGSGPYYYNMNAGAGVSLNSLDSGYFTTFVDDIENLFTISFSTSSVLGNTSANVITTGSGNDTIDGGGGNDTIDAGAGDDLMFMRAGDATDTYDGGAGVDTVNFTNTGLDTTIDLAAGLWRFGLGVPTVGMANVENIIASGGDDSITGSSAANFLDGGGGDDTLIGGGGNDSLRGAADDDDLQGGSGVDTLKGGNGNDTLDGGTSNDVIDGGGGNDLMFMRLGDGADSYDGGSGIDTVDFTNTNINTFVDLQNETWNFSSPTPNDDMKNVENLNMSGGNDTVIGSNGANIIYGRGGDDSLNGLGGADYLNGEDGDDTVNGGDGADELRGGAGADLLIGGNGNDNIRGGNDDDTLRGQAGQDTLTGGNGNDFLRGGAEADTLDGGANVDTALYTTDTADLTINLGVGTGLGGDAQGDTLISIENLVSGSGNDSLIGSTANNLIEAMDGADTVKAGSGDDTIVGGNGDDVLAGGTGDDSIRGGAGRDQIKGGPGADTLNGGQDIDTLQYQNDSVGVTVHLGNNTASGGEATGDVISNFENVTGGTGDDILSGSDMRNVLVGGRGGDQLRGGNGKDVLAGERGGDFLSGGNGDDTLKGGNGADTLKGGNGDDVLRGSNGADVFIFGAGDDNDTLVKFQVGIDTMRIEGLTQANVSFSNAGGGDTLMTLTTGDTVLFTDTTVGQLNTFADFIFV